MEVIMARAGARRDGPAPPKPGGARPTCARELSHISTVITARAARRARQPALITTRIPQHPAPTRAHPPRRIPQHPTSNRIDAGSGVVRAAPIPPSMRLRAAPACIEAVRRGGGGTPGRFEGRAGQTGLVGLTLAALRRVPRR
jgi:hypothetical protein